MDIHALLPVDSHHCRKEEIKITGDVATENDVFGAELLQKRCGEFGKTRTELRKNFSGSIISLINKSDLFGSFHHLPCES